MIRKDYLCTKGHAIAVTGFVPLDDVIECPILACNARATTGSDTSGPNDPVLQLLNVKTAFLESAEKECDELLNALLGTSDRDMEDGTPCWCVDPPRRMKPKHDEYCEKARNVIAARKGDTPAAEKGE